jgi:hypothetical protein
MTATGPIKVFASDVGLDPPIGGNDNVQAALAAAGVPPGVSIVRKFPFAFNDAGLAAGKTIYVPTIGDILHECWVQIDTAWNGTTPFGDVGTFVGLNSGFFSGIGPAPLDMTQADAVQTGNGTLVGASGPSAATLAAIVDALQLVGTGGGLNPTGLSSLASLTSLAPAGRLFPCEFSTADPIKVCVSQTGQAGGADPGATQGAGFVYLVTATPA